jgi:hypothetical protein
MNIWKLFYVLRVFFSSFFLKTNEYIRYYTVEITRPTEGSPAPYTAGDVISDSTTAPTLPSITLDADPAARMGVIVFFTRIQTNNVLWASTRFKVHFFSNTITPHNDNATYEMKYTNATKRNGSVDVAMDTANLGTTDSVAGFNDYNKIAMEPAANVMNLQLQVLDAKTPISEQKYTIQVGVIIKKY